MYNTSVLFTISQTFKLHVLTTSLNISIQIKSSKRWMDKMATCRCHSGTKLAINSVLCLSKISRWKKILWIINTLDMTVFLRLVKQRINSIIGLTKYSTAIATGKELVVMLNNFFGTCLTISVFSWWLFSLLVCFGVLVCKSILCVILLVGFLSNCIFVCLFVIQIILSSLVMRLCV